MNFSNETWAKLCFMCVALETVDAHSQTSSVSTHSFEHDLIIQQHPKYQHRIWPTYLETHLLIFKTKKA